MTAVAEKGAGRRVMPAVTAAAGMARVDTDVKDRASSRENTIAIDRWEDEGGAGESPAEDSATPNSIPWRPLTIRRPADS